MVIIKLFCKARRAQDTPKALLLVPPVVKDAFCFYEARDQPLKDTQRNSMQLAPVTGAIAPRLSPFKAQPTPNLNMFILFDPNHM